MILSENQIKVPGKIYKVRIKCVSTQRLTTIEWLILSCTKKFENQSSMSERTLKYAFEEVFQFQNSELLIKPCLKHLRRLGVIKIEDGDAFKYDSLRFANIELTELGDFMLKNGLLPGEPREIGLDIYYNPLTGKLSGYDNSPTNIKDCLDFGSASDYDQNFPEQRVIDELQAGSVGGGRFVASKFQIEEIESLKATDWKCVITMAVDVNEKGEIKTTPEIVAPNVNRLLLSLFMTKEITKQLTESLPEIGSLEVRQLIGSSKNMKEAILDVCKNGKFIFVDAQIYQLYKRNTASFKDTTVIIFNSKDGLSIENEKGLNLLIPDEFPISGCVVVNEKGEHVSLCKATYTYANTPITVPLAVEDNRIGGINKIVIKWLEDIIRARYQDDIRYVGLMTLLPSGGNLKEWRDNLYARWITMELKNVVQEINRINVTCLQLKRDMFDISLFIDVLLEKVDSVDYEVVLNNIKVVMDSQCIRKNSTAHRLLVDSIVKRVKAPNTYPDLYRMLESLVGRKVINYTNI